MNRSVFRNVIASSILLTTLWLSACKPTPDNPALILATTTSTQDSGLLDVLIPAFEAESGYLVQIVAVGTGEALKMGEEGNADVLLVHAPSSEVTFMENGFGSNRRLVMYNDFVIVGPGEDPAGIEGVALATEAFQKIAASGASFVSRGDDSGTNKAELKIWGRAEIYPSGQSWYSETGQGMGSTLTISSEIGAYTLTDRATYLANQENLSLEILLESDTSLLNIYHVITVNPDLWTQVNNAGAIAFADFITSREGQELTASFGLEEFNQSLFTPAADKTDADLGLP